MSKSLGDIEREAGAIERESWHHFWGTVAECASMLNEIDPVRRGPFLAAVQRDLFQAQDGHCALCGKRLQAGDWEVDHKIPFCYGGDGQPTNLQLACIACNRSKGKQVDVWDLLRYLEGRYQSLRRT